jgi:subtilisin family serine protease
VKKVFGLSICLLALAGSVTTGESSAPYRALPGRYIVVFKDAVADPVCQAHQMAMMHGTRPAFVYRHALKGFAAPMTEQAALALSHNPNVAYVEQDAEVWADVIDVIQEGATWGIDRIDERDLPLSGNYSYAYTGVGVTVYVIDTGIDLDHPEFGGRAGSGYDFIDGDNDASDCAGHGTHVAGTIGGATYGVAKEVDLVAVRVLDGGGSGALSQVLAGIDWVTDDHVNGRKGPAVANMSLGGKGSAAMDEAVRRSIASGIAYAVSAGNSAANAGRFSPARVAEAMTVSATDETDTRASFANYGDCVDWFAPGVRIVSAQNGGGETIMSGTSMAAPHTAGVAALYLQKDASATAQDIREALYAAATKAVVKNSKSLNSDLLFSRFDLPQPNEPPAADFGYSVAGLDVTFTDLSSDTDGSIKAWNWDFGDLEASVEAGPRHTYAMAGLYTVTLTVTDDDGATATTSKIISVGSAYPISLTATRLKYRGVPCAELTWSGATTDSVDIYRNGQFYRLRINSGLFRDDLSSVAAGTVLTYQVRESGGSGLSNEATVVK